MQMGLNPRDVRVQDALLVLEDMLDDNTNGGEA